MRLWSIHPQYLDAKGLVALWREGLLAQAVLSGMTRGYRNHPQLERFRDQRDPVATIAAYLHHVADEAEKRGYNFDRSKLRSRSNVTSLRVATGQIAFEWQHLKTKLRERDPARYTRLKSIVSPEAHPIVHIVPGPVAGWERV